MVKSIQNFEEKNILVTGAAGFIGSNLTDVLLEKGANVVGVDNLYNGRLKNLKHALKNSNFTFFKADIRDCNFLFEISKEIDIIFHEAAFASVPDSIKMPITCNEINVCGTLNILECARRHDIETVVMASSASVYGEVLELPMKEGMCTFPISPYGVTKLAGERYLFSYFKIYGLNTVSLRYLNVYGPRQEISPYSGVISKWMGLIYKDNDLMIYGDGEQTRDFIYITDIVRANLMASVTKQISGEFFNIGTGKPITINELASLMKEIWGKDYIKINYMESRLGDLRDGIADINKAREFLKFTPEFDIHTGLREFIKWFRQERKLS